MAAGLATTGIEATDYPVTAGVTWSYTTPPPEAYTFVGQPSSTRSSPALSSNVTTGCRPRRRLARTSPAASSRVSPSHTASGLRANELRTQRPQETVEERAEVAAATNAAASARDFPGNPAARDR